MLRDFFRRFAGCCLGTALVALLGAAPATAQTADHQYSTQDIEAGSRLYAGQCSLCHGPTGDLVSGINLRRQQFRRPLSDDELRRVITAGVPNAGMPPFTLQAAELNGLIAFIRAGFDLTATAVRVGDAARGRTVYASGKSACATCHRIDGVGSHFGPDLSDIGAIRQPGQLQRSLLTPTQGMMPINRPVRIVLRSGETLRGRRMNEDTASVQLLDERSNLRSVAKTDIREYELGKTSPMPSVSGKLTDTEIEDLVAYLLSLKGL